MARVMRPNASGGKARRRSVLREKILALTAFLSATPWLRILTGQRYIGLGECLDRRWGDCADNVRVTKDNFDIAEATLERRLEEARALGMASDGLASHAPHLSARSGLSAGQRSGGWSLLGALLVFAIMVPDTLTTMALLAASGVFALLIALRIASALSAWNKDRQ